MNMQQNDMTGQLCFVEEYLTARHAVRKTVKQESRQEGR
jgi:hypothetical protein